MAVCRAQIGNAHIFKHGSRHEQPFQAVFHVRSRLIDSIAPGDFFQNGSIIPFGMEVILAAANPGKMPGQAADRLADGHFVVIEDDHHGLLADRQLIQGFINHAAGGSTVTHHGDHIIILVQKGTCPGHTQGNGHRTGSVACHKGIRHAFRWFWKSGKPPILPQTGKIRLASRQQLMDIRLMADIKNQAVLLCIIYGFNGNRKLYNAQVSGQMAAGLCHIFNQKLPDLPAQASLLRLGQVQQVLLAMNIL